MRQLGPTRPLHGHGEGWDGGLGWACSGCDLVTHSDLIFLFYLWAKRMHTVMPVANPII